MKKILRILVKILMGCLIGLLILNWGWRQKSREQSEEKNLIDPLRGYMVNVGESTLKPTPTILKVIKKMIVRPTEVGDTAPWGVAVQIDDKSWTMKVAMDEKMAEAREILQALNVYRVKRGSQNLVWDENLGKYAQERANYLDSIKNTDGHKGFSNFLENENGYEKLGFTWLGENISYGYRLEAVHLIEWIFAGDKPHDDNQVNNRWNYAGVGVKGTAVAIIFGTDKK